MTINAQYSFYQTFIYIVMHNTYISIRKSIGRFIHREANAQLNHYKLELLFIKNFLATISTLI